MSWHSFIQKYFGIFFAAGIVLGLAFPGFFMPISDRVFLILGTVITLTFLTLDLKAAAGHLKKFHHIGAAMVLSKAVLPLALYLLAKPLGETISIGVLLLGLTPFATVSPTITKIVGGDAEFILILMILLTLTAPFYMPALLLLYAGESIELDVISMMLSLIKLIIIPFFVSLIIRPLFRKTIQKTQKYYGAATILLITLLLTGLMASASAPVLSDPLKALPMAGIAMLLGVLFSAAGYFLFFFFNKEKRIGLSVANLYMNIGLTAVVAAGFFSADVILFILLYELPANLFPAIFGRIFKKEASL